MQSAHRLRIAIWLQRAPLLAVLTLLGAGLGYLALGQTRGGRVTEIDGLIGNRRHSGPIVFSPDGKTLALPKGGAGAVELWSLETGKVQVLSRAPEIGQQGADSTVFSADCQKLAVKYRSQGITIWRLPAGREQAYIPMTRDGDVSGMVFVGGGRELLAILIRTLADDHATPETKWNLQAVRWNASTGERLWEMNFDRLMEFSALSHNGRYTVLSDETGDAMFDVATGRKLFPLRGYGGYLFSSDDSTLVAYNDAALFVWAMPSGTLTRHINLDHNRGFGSERSDLCRALSPDKRVLAVGQFQGPNGVGLISMESGKVLDRFECCPESTCVLAVAFSPDGRMLATDPTGVGFQDQLVVPMLKLWRVPASW